MATRAAIIYFDGDNGQFTSTYNHYDGYPENLGVALEKHYNDDFKAHKISREGYISYMDPETGDIEQKNQQDPDVEQVYDEDTAASQINDVIQSYGADYAYIFSPALDKWVTIKNAGSNTVMNTLDQLMPEMFGRGDMVDYDSIDNMEEGYKIKWKKFIAENDDATVRFEKIRDNAYRMLKSEDGKQVNDYVDSLVNQIKLNPSDADEYIEYDRTDWKADFDDYISDKMDF
jgi:hypothetical protein